MQKSKLAFDAQTNN